MSAVWSDPNNLIFIPWSAQFTGEPRQKNVYFTPPNASFTGASFPPLNAIGLDLSSNWAGFVV